MGKRRRIQDETVEKLAEILVRLLRLFEILKGRDDNRRNCWFIEKYELTEEDKQEIITF